MKKLLILLLFPLSTFAQGTRFQPGSVPTPVPIYNTTQIVASVLQQIGTNFGVGYQSQVGDNSLTIATNQTLHTYTLTGAGNVTSNYLYFGASLKSFGAVGDGVTDDTVAVQNWANFICSSNSAVGLVPPAPGGSYIISREIQFTNSCWIRALSGGLAYPAGDFGMTKCRFAQISRGSNGFHFTSYADSFMIEGIGITNLAIGNYTNIDSSGFLFTGAIGAHQCIIQQCSAANFGRGAFSVDLASVTFKSCGFNYNQLGIELTNTINGNYPLEIDSCVLAFNYTNQVVVRSTITPLLIVNSIITPNVNPARALYSSAPSTTLINCRIQPNTAADLININGGVANIIGTTIQFIGTAGFYSMVATNCYVNMDSLLTLSNSVNNCVLYLNGTGSKLLSSVPINVLTDDGAGNLTTNIAINTLGFTIPSIAVRTNSGVNGQILTVGSDGMSHWSNAPAGGGGTGTLMPPNAVGVLTNNGSGTTNWSAAFTGAWVASGTLPKTAADSSWMSITNAVAFSNATGVAGIGKGLVVIGTNSYGAILTTDTNWPPGGSVPNGLVTNNGAVSVVVPENFYMTNLTFDVHTWIDVLPANGPFPIKNDVYNKIVFFSMTNGSTSVKSGLRSDYLLPAYGITMDSGAILIQSNGVAGANGWFYLDGISGFHMGVGGNETLTLNSTGTISIIPTNAAAVFTIANVNTALPMGLTNTFVGRAEPLVQYYMIDAVAGTPRMTISNETTGVKILLSTAPLTGLTQTNFTTLPITSTNSVWRIRDESTGSGASVGIITNWLTGL